MFLLLPFFFRVRSCRFLLSSKGSVYHFDKFGDHDDRLEGRVLAIAEQLKSTEEDMSNRRWGGGVGHIN